MLQNLQIMKRLTALEKSLEKINELIELDKHSKVETVNNSAPDVDLDAEIDKQLNGEG